MKPPHSCTQDHLLWAESYGVSRLTGLRPFGTCPNRSLPPRCGRSARVVSTVSQRSIRCKSSVLIVNKLYRPDLAVKCRQGNMDRRHYMRRSLACLLAFGRLQDPVRPAQHRRPAFWLELLFRTIVE